MSTPYNGLIIDHKSMSATAVIEGITMVLIFLGSLIANSLALTTILHDKVLRRNLHNWLILNLILNDIGFTITSTPFVIISVFDNGHFLVHRRAVCLVTGAFALLFAFGNFTTVLAISVDRYLTIVWSARFPSSKIRTIVFIIICWVVPIVNAIPPSFGLLSGIKYHSTDHNCTADWEKDCVYFIICVSILFGVTVPVMAFCYVGVFWNVWRQKQLLRSHGDEKDTEGTTCSSDENIDGCETYLSAFNMDCSSAGCSLDDRPETTDVYKSSNVIEPTGENLRTEKSKDHRQQNAMAKVMKKNRLKKRRSMQKKLTMEKRIALTGTLLVITTMACWAPYCIVNPCLIPVSVPHWLSVGTVWLGYSNTLLDPLIYSFMNRRVRARYLAMLARLMTSCGWRTQ